MLELKAPPSPPLLFLPSSTLERSAESYSELVLDEHEAYIATLEAEYTQLEPLLELIARHDELARDRQEYQIMISDPSRLTSRKGGGQYVLAPSLETSSCCKGSI